MTARFRFRFFSIMVAAVALTVVASPMSSSALAQRNPDRPNIEDLLPETTVAFVQIADIKDMMEKVYSGAGMKFFEEEKIAPLVKRIEEEGRKAYGKIEEQVGLSIDEIQSLPAGEMVFAAIAPRRKNPVFMVILEVGEENEAVDKALGVVRDKITETGNTTEDEELESGTKVEKITIDGEEAFMARRDGLIVGCSQEKELNDFFLRWDGEEVEKVRPLSKNRKFITIMNRCRSQKDLESEIKFFFDPIGLFKSAGRGNVEMQVAIAFLPTLGLDSLLGLGGSVILGDEEYETIMHSHLLLSSPRKGVTKVLAFKPNDYEPEMWMPSDVYFYTTTSWDVPQMFNEIRGLVDLAMGEGNFDNFVGENIDDRLEMSFEDEILSQLSGRISFSQVTSVPGKLNSASWVIGMGLNNVDEAKDVVTTLVEFINENVADDSIKATEYEGITYWAVDEATTEARNEQRAERRRERNERRGREADSGDEFRATIRMPRPTISIVGSSLIFTDSIEAFEKVVATYKGEAEPLRNDKDFIKMADQMTRLLGTDMPVALSYSQPRNQVESLLKFAGSDESKSFLASNSENNEFWKVVKGVMDDHELPSMDVMNKYMLPQGWFATSDDTGYHLLWFQERLVLEDE